MRTTSCRDSTLAIVDRLFLYAVRTLASPRIGEGVVEGVHRIGRCDFNPTVGAGRQIANSNIYSVAVGVPEEEHLVPAG